jgi:hypothetical protein
MRVSSGAPVISVDTKKKELVGDFKNGGREWQPKGEPELVDVQDLPAGCRWQGDPIRRLRCGSQRRLRQCGRRSRYAGVRGDDDRGVVDAGRLPTLPRCARDLHHRRRRRQQRLSRTRVEAPTPAHRGQAPHRYPRQPLPPGTSKWNKIEHRLFSFISINWRGRPLRSYETVVNLIANTTNRGGLVVRARLDKRRYPTGKKIAAKEFKTINIKPDEWHGDWNYVIRPRENS